MKKLFATVVPRFTAVVTGLSALLLSSMRSPMFRFLLGSTVSLGLSAVCTKAAVYQEVGGVVVIEAVHFDYRNYEFTDAAIPHHFHIVPDENNVTSATHPWGDTGNNPSDPGGATWSMIH